MLHLKQRDIPYHKKSHSLSHWVVNLGAAKFEVLINRMCWQRIWTINDHLMEKRWAVTLKAKLKPRKILMLALKVIQQLYKSGCLWPKSGSQFSVSQWLLLWGLPYACTTFFPSYRFQLFHGTCEFVYPSFTCSYMWLWDMTQCKYYLEDKDRYLLFLPGIQA